MPDGRNSGYPFPWGVDWDGTCCNNSVSSQASQSTTPVQRYEGRGDSPLGIVDMSGNVSEWCLTARHTGDIDPDGTGERVQRGGAWFHFTTMFFSVTATYGSDPDRRETTLGFRLARK